MEDSANFIPLGLGKERRGSASKPARNVPTSISARNVSTARRASSGPSILDGPKVIGATPAERSAIAKEYRLAAKRVKKKAKADAKRARKENAILHRRMTRNNEKYSKNKDRNRERDILLERQRLRFEAVRQAERLAAIHDPTGKMFNVGEVVIMPDGQVKSKEAIARAAEAKKQKEIEAAAEKLENIRLAEEKAKYREAKLQAKREGREAPPRPDYTPQIDLQSSASFYGNRSGGQPAYSGQQMGRQPATGAKPPRKISKKQQQRQEMLKPKPVPPKPVIPEGIALPAGEENLLLLWDISDEQIIKRLNSKKKEKILAAKKLRLIQKEQKKFNRAMKVRKKQAANAGVLWDAEKAKKEILGEMEKANWGEENSSDTNSDSDSDYDSDSESEAEAEANGKTGKKASSDDNDDSGSSSSSDSSSDSDSDTDSDAEAGDTPKKKKKGMPKVNRPRLDLELLEQAAKIKQAHDEKKRNARLKRRAERREKAAQEQAKKEAEAEAARIEAEKAEKAKLETALKEKTAKESSKKRKRSSEEEPEQNGKKSKSDDGESDEEAKRKAERKKRRKEEKKAKAGLLASSMDIVESKDDKLDREIAAREAKLLEGNQETEEVPQYAKVATNWNPDALAGDEQRKEKYLRLLGAKKDSKKSNNEKAETEKQEGAREQEEQLAAKIAQPNIIDRKEKKRARRAARKAEEDAAEAAAATAKAEQLARMQRDLEKQYEAGMKLKHDGGSKRRGLGA